MLTTIKVHSKDAELLKTIKEKTGLTSNSTIIKLALANFINSQEYAKLVLKLK